MKLDGSSDHTGYQAKEHLKRWLAERGHQVEDVGTHGTASVDYPDYAGQVGRLVGRPPK